MMSRPLARQDFTLTVLRAFHPPQPISLRELCWKGTNLLETRRHGEPWPSSAVPSHPIGLPGAEKSLRLTPTPNATMERQLFP
jgi:hypothetical protein